MTSEHSVFWLEAEFRRHKLVPDGDGGTRRPRSEFVETKPRQEIEYECKCGEFFVNEDAAREHLRRVQQGEDPV